MNILITCSEAQKALREINSTHNSGLKIHAEFAFERRKSQSEPEIVFAQPNENNEENWENGQVVDAEAQLKFHPPMAIDLNRSVDNVNEIVTEFCRFKAELSYSMQKTSEMLKKLSDQSMGQYEPEDVRSLSSNLYATQ